MKLPIDKEADALYLCLENAVIVESEEIVSGVVLETNEADHRVGIEIPDLLKRSSNLNMSTLESVTI